MQGVLCPQQATCRSWSIRHNLGAAGPPPATPHRDSSSPLGVPARPPHLLGKGQCLRGQKNTERQVRVMPISLVIVSKTQSLLRAVTVLGLPGPQGFPKTKYSREHGHLASMTGLHPGAHPQQAHSFGGTRAPPKPPTPLGILKFLTPNPSLSPWTVESSSPISPKHRQLAC